MIPANDPRTTSFPHRAPLVAASQPPSGDGKQTTPVDHVAQLSAVVGYLRGLEAHHRDDRRLQSRAREAAARVQALASALKVAAEPAHLTRPRTTAPEPARAHDELKADEVPADEVPADEVPLDEPVPMHRALLGRPLTVQAVTTLGPRADSTIEPAASEPRHAIQDLDGPRCRAYRAAAYFLRNHPITLTLDHEQASR